MGPSSPRSGRVSGHRFAAKLLLEQTGLSKLDMGAVSVDEEIVRDNPRHARNVDHIGAHSGKALTKPVLQPVCRRHRQYHGNDTDNYVDRDDTKSGTRLGLGAEIPLNKRSFARLDYSYTEYDDYSVDYVTGVDSFDNSEAVVRLGVGWRY